MSRINDYIRNYGDFYCIDEHFFNAKVAGLGSMVLQSDTASVHDFKTH